MGFCHLQDIYPLNMKKKTIGYCYKSRIKWWKKNTSKKVVHKTAEPTRELIGNKTAEKMWN